MEEHEVETINENTTILLSFWDGEIVLLFIGKSQMKGQTWVKKFLSPQFHNSFDIPYSKHNVVRQCYNRAKETRDMEIKCGIWKKVDLKKIYTIKFLKKKKYF